VSMRQSHTGEDELGIIEMYKNIVYKIALMHTKNQTDADDAFQETFLAYFSKIRVFHDEEHRKAWLIRTAINCSKKITASSWRKKIIFLNDHDIFDKTFKFLLKEENTLYIAIKDLPIKYRTVIYLHYFEEFSAEKIALVLNIKPSTVRMQLMRGRNLLRERLKGDYFNEE
jgi:RNA polymerase sigma-70 factor (ECF subfamily)